MKVESTMRVPFEDVVLVFKAPKLNEMAELGDKEVAGKIINSLVKVDGKIVDEEGNELSLEKFKQVLPFTLAVEIVKAWSSAVNVLAGEKPVSAEKKEIAPV
jgi:hypothetical protein